MGPDWSLLPSELVQLISEKIQFTNFYHRFRAVCWPWRRATHLHPLHISSVPWLRFPPNSQEISSTPNKSTISYYDFSQSKIRQFDFSEDTYKGVIGSSRSWLVLEQDMAFSLLNPITRERKDNLFPSLDAPPNIVESAFNTRTENRSTLASIRGSNYRIEKVVLTSSPSQENCALVASFYSIGPWELAFCRVRDTCWTVLKLPEIGRGSRTMLNFKCENGLIYAINDKCIISVYDLRGSSEKIMSAKLSSFKWGDSVYLVEGKGEHDGPLVVRYADPEIQEDKIEVYECLDSYGDGTRCRYKRVKDIGNNVMFLDGKRCVLVSCSDIHSGQWKRNHIYYPDQEEDLDDDYYYLTLKSLDIKNSSVKKVVYESIGLFPIWSNPRWFTASVY